MRSFSNVYKLIVAGDGGVGKTTLLYQYVKGTFVENTGMTIGVQFHAKDITIEGVLYSLQLWDLGGQDRFRFMLPSYTLGAKGALLLYDLTSMSSLETLEQWVTICRTHNSTMPILLCGTKADLVHERSVQEDYAKTFLRSLNLIDHLEISAKTGQNVEKAFELIVKAIKKESPKAT